MGKYSKLPPDQRAAQRALHKVLKLGEPRHNNKNDGFVHSRGTARQYKQTYKLLYRFCRVHGERLQTLTPKLAEKYIEFRSPQIQQKQLNNERLALNKYLSQVHNRSIELPFKVSGRKSSYPTNRAYSHGQIKQLIDAAKDAGNRRLAVSIALAYTAGLRAEELHTITPPGMNNPSSHRRWSTDRYTGREHWIATTVNGKGGLSREVRYTPELSDFLKREYLRDHPIEITDKCRDVRYQSHYNLIGGQKFSKAFGELSKKLFGWSNGAHGLRHSFAQRRDAELKNHFPHEHANKILAQELGHFDTSNLVYYLV